MNEGKCRKVQAHRIVYQVDELESDEECTVHRKENYLEGNTNNYAKLEYK